MHYWIFLLCNNNAVVTKIDSLLFYFLLLIPVLCIYVIVIIIIIIIIILCLITRTASQVAYIRQTMNYSYNYNKGYMHKLYCRVLVSIHPQCLLGHIFSHSFLKPVCSVYSVSCNLFCTLMLVYLYCFMPDVFHAVLNLVSLIWMITSFCVPRTVSHFHPVLYLSHCLHALGW